MSVSIARATPPVTAPAFHCLGCSHKAHDPKQCGDVKRFTKDPCDCPFTRAQVYVR